MENNTLVVKLRCYNLTYDYALYGWHGIVYIILIVGYGLLFIPTALFNMAAINVFANGRKQRQSNSSLLMLNTAIADCFTGLLALPLGFLHFLLVVAQKQIYCLLYSATTFACYLVCVLSFIMVSFVSVDRYVAVFYPFRYCKRDWNRVYMVLNICSWIFTIALVASSFTTKLFKPTFYFLTAQPLVIIANCFMLTRVWFAIKKARKADLNSLRIQPFPRKPSLVNTKNDHSNTGDATKQIHVTVDKKPRRKTGTSKHSMDHTTDAYLSQLNIRHQRVQIKKGERKTSRLIMFMLLSVCACYLPYFMIVTWWMIDPNYTDTSHTLGNIAMFFVPVKALLNPIIYFYSMPSIRQMMKEFILCRKRIDKNTIGTSSKANTIF